MAPSTAVAAPGRTREAVRGATPLALAGLLANGANVLVTLVVARALPTRAYGALAQLLAVFFVVSMPGNALLVGVVRRVTAWRRADRADRVVAWVARVRRVGLAVVAAVVGAAVLSRGLIADELSLPGPGGVVEVLAAGAAWGLLCVERGLLQSARAYRGLAANLLVEGLLRCALTVGLILAG
ncbi:MAG TPA: hypothetical protein VKP11_09165, partial [Frankiaceae bacterium]|nr:hypothetical protein [Frankiaceae bacterium]